MKVQIISWTKRPNWTKSNSFSLSLALKIHQAKIIGTQLPKIAH